MFSNHENRSSVRRENPEAAVLSLSWRRPGHRDSQQRRSSVSGRAAAAIEQARLVARAQPQSQPRTEKYLQGRSPYRCRQAWTFPGVLRRPGGQGNEAGNGAPDAGAQNCCNHVDGLEERSLVRRPTKEYFLDAAQHHVRPPQLRLLRVTNLTGGEVSGHVDHIVDRQFLYHRFHHVRPCPCASPVLHVE